MNIFKNKAIGYRRSAGFTLIETLVAIAILMIAIAGPLTVAEKGLSAAIYARDQLMASYLAQDGMEYIKNTIDSNEININQNLATISWLAVNSSVTDLSSCTPSTPCTIDTINGVITNNCTVVTSQVSCQALSLGPNGYIQSSGQSAPFTRYFYLQGFNPDGTPCTSSACNAENVVVNVAWPGEITGGGGVMLEDTMFNTPLQ